MLGGANASDEGSFRFILANKALAATSAGIQGIALPWLILELTGSPLHLGVAFALRTAPDVLLAPVVGTAIDSLPRKWVFVAAEGLRGLTLLTLPALALSGGLAIWHVFVAMVGLSVFTSLAYNTRRTILPSVVDESALDRANSRLQGVDAVLSLAFVGVGGGFLATIGTAYALLAAVVGSLLAGVVLLPLGLPEREGADVPGRFGLVEGIPSGQRGARVLSAATRVLESVRERGREGVGAIRRNRLLLELLALGIAVNLFMVPIPSVLVPTLGRDVFGGAVGFTVLLLGLRGGMVAGNWVAGWLGWTARRKILAGLLLVGVAAVSVVVGVSALRWLGWLPGLLLASAALFLVGLGQPLFNVPTSSLLQAAPEESDRGRVVTFVNSVLQASFPIPLLLAGAAVTVLSPVWLFVVGGVGLIGVGIAVERRFELRPA